jgi:hypothetical protein
VNKNYNQPKNTDTQKEPTKMKTKFRGLARAAYVAVASALAIAVVLPALVQDASALQVTSRSIEMSSATASATNTSYKVSFTPGQNANVQAIIVDFCDNDPLVGDTTCTLPGGFSITASPGVTAQSSGAGCVLTTFTTASQLNSNRTLELAAASPVALTTSGACSFTITTVTNPNTADHSFYARIYTYDTTTHANSYAAGGSTGVVDSGGIALSTTDTISITARVMEQLTYCVAAGTSTNGGTNPIGSACGSGLGSAAITLGHGANNVLDASAVDAFAAWSQLSTNATSGAVVRMKASNACTNGGLSANGGSTCNIQGTGATAVLVAAGGGGTGKFGMCVAPGSNTTADAPYVDTGNGCPSAWNATSVYGMDGNGATGTTSTYGSQIFHVTGPVSNENNRATFVATAASTTPAGIYTGNESLIATGTF